MPSADSGSRRIDLGSHALRCSQAGAGETVFLCLHGLSDEMGIWSRLGPRLEARGRVVRFDQRGHGGSGAPPGPFTRDDLADDVVGVLDALGIERAVLVGHSLGGIVSLATALAHPQRVSGLVLIGTASRCNEKAAARYERIAVAGETEGLPAMARAIYGRDSSREISGEVGALAALLRMLKGLHTDPLTPKLAAITCPVLLVVGEKDPMGPRASQHIHDALPEGRARLQVISGCGHWPHVEAPEEVLRALDDWLGTDPA